jgi:Ni,Fe-hydrogenase I cytochrome b subunit
MLGVTAFFPVAYLLELLCLFMLFFTGTYVGRRFDIGP